MDLKCNFLISRDVPPIPREDLYMDPGLFGLGGQALLEPGCTAPYTDHIP